MLAINENLASSSSRINGNEGVIHGLLISKTVASLSDTL